MSDKPSGLPARRGCTISGCIFGAIVILLLMMVGIGAGLAEIGVALLFGWIAFLADVWPRISWNWAAIITAIHHRHSVRFPPGVSESRLFYLAGSRYCACAGHGLSMALEVDLQRINFNGALFSYWDGGHRSGSSSRVDTKQRPILV